MAMQIPTDLGAWTYETIVELVGNHDYEPGRFDFKEVLSATRGEGHTKQLNAAIRKEVCAFANTLGGFLIFGVKDAKNVKAPGENRIVGIPLSGEHRKDLGEKLAMIQPVPHFESSPQAIRLPHDPQAGVFVVYVPPSPYRPHMVLPEHLFYGRDDGGAATPLGYYQVKELMRTTEERLRKLALIRIEIGNLQTFIGLMASLPLVDVIVRERLDTTALQLLLADTSILSLDLDVLHPLLLIPAAASRINNQLEMYIRSGISPTKLTEQTRQTGEVSLRQQLTLLHGLCVEVDGRIMTTIGPQAIVTDTVSAFAAELQKLR